tara:strand:- start:188 stop:712 length:525 start_codon:yes stop_codon:yes gene_type:complete
MTKKLEETFNLPDIADLAPEDQLEEVHDPSGEVASAPPEVIQTREALTLAHKIDNALPEVKDINTSDTDMDRYADKAEKAFEDLMDLGFNVEDRNAGHVFGAAQTMLKNAIEAKNAKADRKLRAIELQLKKLRLDQNDQKNTGYVTNDVIDVDYVISDRNSIINELTKKLINDK